MEIIKNNGFSKVRIGVIGVGHMGQYHVNILSSLPEVELVGFSEINEDLARHISEKYNITYFKDYKDLFKYVDGVVIATPTYTHYKIVKDSLEAGKHVLVEKPITNTVYSARKLVDLSREKNLILQVGHVERFNAAVQELKNIITKPYYIEAKRVGPKNTRIKDIGVVLDLMIHDIDIVLSLVKSDIVEVKAYGLRVYSGFEDVAIAVLYFQNGVFAHILASRTAQHKIRVLEISQEDAFVVLDYASQDITVYRNAATGYFVKLGEIKYVQDEFIEKVFVHKDNALKLELLHFIESIKNGKNNEYDNEVDLKALEVAHLILAEIHRNWQKMGTEAFKNNTEIKSNEVRF